MNANKAMGKYHCLGVFFIAAFSAYVIFNLRIYGLPQNAKKNYYSIRKDRLGPPQPIGDRQKRLMKFYSKTAVHF